MVAVEVKDRKAKKNEDEILQILQMQAPLFPADGVLSWTCNFKKTSQVLQTCKYQL